MNKLLVIVLLRRVALRCSAIRTSIADYLLGLKE